MRFAFIHRDEWVVKFSRDNLQLSATDFMETPVVLKRGLSFDSRRQVDIKLKEVC